MSRPNPVFTDVAWNDVPKSWFDHSHKWEGTSDFSKLIPVYWDYFRPGDVIKGNLSIFGRSLPLSQPVYGDAFLHVDWFAVPLRLLWKNFTEYITGVTNRGVPVTHRYPYIPYRMYFDTIGLSVPVNETDVSDPGVFTHGSLVDYLGAPTPFSYASDATGSWKFTGEVDIQNPLYVWSLDALPFRAYAEIWNEYFRDEQLQDYIAFYDGDGAEQEQAGSSNTVYGLKTVCAEKDRFTTARPNPQLGEAAGAFVDVTALGSAGGSGLYSSILSDGSATIYRQGMSPTTGSFDFKTSISNLRAAVTLQHILEARNVGGFRYFEQVLTDFGVKMSDVRAQRPEFITGDTVPFMINSVTQSSPSDGTATDVLGTQAGQGMFNKNTDDVYYESNEDCIVMAVMFVRPRAFYYQNFRKQLLSGYKFFESGAEQSFFDSTYDKFYNPKLQGLGDEVVNQYEVALGSDESLRDPFAVFGYASQYSDWKYRQNEVHGEFRGTLKDWVYTRDLIDARGRAAGLTDVVQLSPLDYRHIYAYNLVNDIEESQDYDEMVKYMLNSSVNDHLLFDMSFNLEVRRSLEYYGTPGVGII